MTSFNSILRFCFLLYISFLIWNKGEGQEKKESADSWQALQITMAFQRYHQQFSGPNSPVYHGYQYVPFILPATGNPFYPTEGWHVGMVCYNGQIYGPLPLMYDILKDQLVLQSPDKLYRILLPAKKVKWFTLDSLWFIHLDGEDTLDRNVPPSGYYEQAGGTRVQLLVKRQKNVVLPVSGSNKRSFRSQDFFYIKKNNHYYNVKTRGSVLKVLSDRKKEIRRYLRKNKIYFMHDRENAIRRAISFYNRMTTGGS